MTLLRLLLLLSLSLAVNAQKIRHQGALPGATPGAVAATFSLYSQNEGGTPLWSEIHTIQVRPGGGYSALLGSVKALPAELFATGEELWLEVEVSGVKQPRELLVAVPYSLHANQTARLGGLPVSSYLRADSPIPPTLDKAGPDLTPSTSNFLGVFLDATDIGYSAVYQTGLSVVVGGSASLGAATLIGNVPSGDTPGMALYNQGGGSGASVSLDMYNTSFNGGVPQAKIKAIDDGAYSDNLTFLTKVPGGAGNAVAESVRITSAGNVGVGTKTPGAMLEVAGSLHVSGIGNGVIFPDGTIRTSSSGNQGPQGPSGPSGAIGPAGQTGAAGAAGTNGSQGPTGASVTAANAAAIAQLNWGNYSSVSYDLLNTPAAIAFDGTNMWLANTNTAYFGYTTNGNGTVTTILTSTGQPTATYNVGNGSLAMAFDGSNMWIANSADNTVTELSAATGQLIATYNVGTFPVAIVFDGTNIWVSNQGDKSLTELSASSGAVIASYSLGSVPGALAIDGSNIWVVTSGNYVMKIPTSIGGAGGSYAVGNSPAAIAFDGYNMWVLNQGDNTVTKLLASNGSIVGTYALGQSLGTPQSLVFDGAHIWVIFDNGAQGGNLSELQAATGSILGTYSFQTPLDILAFDGTNLWLGGTAYSFGGSHPSLIKFTAAAQ